jgi:hypothetical protein
MASGGGRRRALGREKANAWPRREPVGAWLMGILNTNR